MARLDMQAAELAGNCASSEALFGLGMMYCLGRDVPQDYVSAHKYFNLAAQLGNADARTYRSEISREMSAAQICEAQRLARDWISVH